MNAGGKTTYANGCALSPSANDGSGHPEGQPCATLSGMDAVMAAAKAADVVILALGLDIKMRITAGGGNGRVAITHPVLGVRLTVNMAVIDLR